MDVEFTDLQRLPDRDLLHRVVGDGASGITSLARAFGLQRGDDTGYKSGSGHQLLLCARELMSRALAESIEGRPALGQPRAVQEFLRLKIGGLSYESFWVLFMDSQVRLIRAEELFRGTLTQTSVYPREIVKRALHFNAASVILAHNHPLC
jgi:DNA repair protein RadC